MDTFELIAKHRLTVTACAGFVRVSGPRTLGDSVKFYDDFKTPAQAIEAAVLETVALEIPN